MQDAERLTRLVITRKTGEGVRITLPDGNFVDVFLHRIDQSRARLRFESPPTIRINRLEAIPRPPAEGGAS